jgi:hypothetical protein
VNHRLDGAAAAGPRARTSALGKCHVARAIANAADGKAVPPAERNENPPSGKRADVASSTDESKLGCHDVQAAFRQRPPISPLSPSAHWKSASSAQTLPVFPCLQLIPAIRFIPKKSKVPILEVPMSGNDLPLGVATSHTRPTLRRWQINCGLS